MPGVPQVKAAAAAAILSTKWLSDDERESIAGQRYFVHPHVATVKPGEPALVRYLEDIYDPSRRPSVEVAAPSGREFKALRTTSDIVTSTRAMAEVLREAMESKSAKPGILFAFAFTLETRRTGFGVIKADLEDEQRFYLQVEGRKWNLAAVQDILPPPQTKYAKYAIVPRPRGRGDAGVRDTQAEPDSAADYFLEAVGIEVPRVSGTKAAFAQVALRSGYDPDDVRSGLASIVVDTPVNDLVEARFPDISEADRKRLQGSPQRPMKNVIASDSYLRTWFTKSPHFELTVDERVEVTFNGRVVQVTLPPDHDDISHRAH